MDENSVCRDFRHTAEGGKTYQTKYDNLKAILTQSKDKAIRAVDHQQTLLYWHVGKRIFDEKQEGKERADYGKYLTQFIAGIGTGIWQWFFCKAN